MRGHPTCPGEILTQPAFGVPDIRKRRMASHIFSQGIMTKSVTPLGIYRETCIEYGSGPNSLDYGAHQNGSQRLIPKDHQSKYIEAGVVIR